MVFSSRSSIVFFIFSVLIYADSVQATSPIVFTINAREAISTSSLPAQLPSSCVIDCFSVSADAEVDAAELQYLLGISEHAMITPSLLAQGVSRVMQKKKFDTLVLTLTGDARSMHLHCHCVVGWTMHGLRMHGLAIGKDFYRQYYTIEPGEPFDRHKHAHALTVLRTLLMDEGYYGAQIADWVEHDDLSKAVTVHIRIDKEDLFSVGGVTCVLAPESDEQDAGISEVLESAGAFLRERLEGGPCTHAVLNETTKELTGLLAQHGYGDVSIELRKTVAHDAKMVSLLFSLTLVHKKQFLFQGNRFFSSEQLLETILSIGYAVPFLPAFFFQQELQKKYHEAGFWHASITCAEASSIVNVTIEEGERAMITDVSVRDEHNTITPRGIKKATRALLKQQFADQASVDQALCDIIAWYRAHGYERASVLSYEYLPVGSQRYALQISIREGKKPDVQLPGMTLVQEISDTARFGKTIIVGNGRVPFSTIMRELGYQEGELWEEKKLSASYERLQKLGLFEEISWQPIDVDGQRTVIWRVVEDEPFELQTRVGLALQQFAYNYQLLGLTYKAGGTFLIKNPTHTGDQIRIDADVTRTQRTMLAQYVHPWILSLPVHMRLQGYHNTYWQPGLCDNRQTLYRVTQQGFVTGFARNVDTVEAGFSCGLERMKTVIRTDCPRQGMFADRLARALYFEPALLDVPILYLLLEPTLIVNRVDNALEPRCGSFSLFSAKGMFPCNHGLNAPFVKVVLEQSLFAPCRSSVVALRLRLGHIFQHSLATIMPSERFYLGGANSVRSYETDMCPPLGVIDTAVCSDDGSRCLQLVPRGGATMVNGSIEIRMPLIDRLGIVLFQDFGVLRGDPCEDSIEQDFVAATGFGLRYITPLGPLRFDIGWKWNDSPNNLLPSECSYAWFLTFGHAF